MRITRTTKAEIRAYTRADNKALVSSSYCIGKPSELAFETIIPVKTVIKTVIAIASFILFDLPGIITDIRFPFLPVNYDSESTFKALAELSYQSKDK